MAVFNSSTLKNEMIYFFVHCRCPYDTSFHESGTSPPFMHLLNSISRYNLGKNYYNIGYIIQKNLSLLKDGRKKLDCAITAPERIYHYYLSYDTENYEKLARKKPLSRAFSNSIVVMVVLYTST